MLNRYLLLAVPIALIVLILVTSFQVGLERNFNHLVFLSGTTVVLFGFQVYKNPSFNLTTRITWYLFLFLIPSITALVYWFKFLNSNTEDEQQNYD